MIKFNAIAMIHPMMTYSIPHFERSPPIAGPIRNARPKAAPIKPIFFVFSSGFEISEIYACTTQNPAPQSPETKRAPMKIRKSVYVSKGREKLFERLRYKIVYPRRLSPDVSMRIFFLQ